MKEPIIQTERLCKSYAADGVQAHVLSNVDLALYAGDFTAIMGPSGSGKSTLLYCLSGLEEADAGSIEVMGRQVVGAGRGELSKTRRDCVGFIFQSPLL